MSKVLIRPYQPNDFIMSALLCQGCLPLEGVTQAEFTRRVLNDPNFDAHGSFVAISNTLIVGFVHAVHRSCPVEGPNVLDGDTGYIVLLAVEEKSRRKGIASSLLSSAESYLRSRGVSKILVGPYSPFYFAPGVGCEYEPGLAFFESHGYVEAARPLAMRASLTPFVYPEWVMTNNLAEKNISTPDWYPELTLPMIEFAREKFAPDWARIVRDAVTDIASGDDRKRLRAAVDRSDGKYEVIGVSHYKGERFGPIGVDPAHRGKGIGHALCAETLRAQQEAGHREAYFLWSNDETAERLYNSFGFKEWRRFVTFKKSF